MLHGVAVCDGKVLLDPGVEFGHVADLGIIVEDDIGLLLRQKRIVLFKTRVTVGARDDGCLRDGQRAVCHQKAEAVLLTDGLYFSISKNAIATANRLKAGFAAKGYRFFMDSPTNQLFVVLENTQLAALEGKAKFGFWEKFDDSHTVVRIATSWATKMEEIEQLIALM